MKADGFHKNYFISSLYVMLFEKFKNVTNFKAGGGSSVKALKDW